MDFIKQIRSIFFVLSLVFLTCFVRIAYSSPGGEVNIVVTNADDAGTGSFREALTIASTNGDYDIITFGPGLRDETITLTSELPGLSESGIVIDGTGSPVIDGTNVIDGIGINIINSSGISDISISGLRLVGFKNGINIGGTVSNINIHGNEISANTDYLDCRITIGFYPSGGTSSNINITNLLYDCTVKYGGSVKWGQQNQKPNT